MSDTSTGDREQCPLHGCEKILGDGHWYAKPNPDSPMAYHTDSEGIARHWEHIDGINVTPKTYPFPEGTIGHRRSVATGEE